ncbi:MAG: hypothetical protein QXI77_01930 [Nanopusillaceae archaeon]
MVKTNILEQKNQSSRVANSSEMTMEKIIKKLEDVIGTFNSKVFKDRSPVYVSEETTINEYVSNLSLSYYSIDIMIARPYLEYVLNNYRENPELIKDLMERVFSKYIETYMDKRVYRDQFSKIYYAWKKKLKKEKRGCDGYLLLTYDWFRMVYEGVQTIIKNLYKTIVSEYKIDTNESLEEILEKMGKYVIEKFKDKEYLKNLEEKLRGEFNEEKIAEKVKKISENYYKCKDIESLDEENLTGETLKIIYYELSPLILQKNPGILKILEDLSSKPRKELIKKFPPKYVLTKIPIDQYKKIISDELGEKFKIVEDTLLCIKKDYAKDYNCY